MAETLPDLLDGGRGEPGAVAISTPGAETTYRALAAEAERWCAAVAGAAPAGAPVAVSLADPVRFIAAVLGAWQAGCPVVPLDPSRHPSDAAGAIRESGAALLIGARAAGPAARAAAPGCRVLRFPGSGRGGTRPVAPDDPALLLHTSGTTGTAKCVVFSHRAMVRNAVALIEAIGLGPDDRFMTPLAPALTTALATCVLPGLAVGACVLLPGRFLPLGTVRTLRDGRVTVFLGVPYVYHLLSQLASKPLRLDALRMSITNSAPMEPAVAEGFERIFGMLPRSNYCSSEAGGITFNGADDRDLQLASVGTALPGVRIRVVDPAGQPLPAGGEGRIVVESRMTASGYLRRPDLTAEVFRDDGIWTDDLGVVDAAGYLRVTGRHSDMLNVGGHLVNPAEVEAVLAGHAAVAEVLVLGDADDAAGTRLRALVVPSGDVQVGDLRTFCFDRLAGHKVPQRFELVDALPRTALGKLRRRPEP